MNTNLRRFSILIFAVSIVSAAFFAATAYALFCEENDELVCIGKEAPGVWLFTGPSGLTVDKTLNVNVAGELSAETELCVFETGYALHVIDNIATQTRPPNTIKVTSGPFQDQTIPISITRGEEGECFGTQVISKEGSQSTFMGSKTFDTSNLPEGDYTMEVELEDNLYARGFGSLTFTVDHPSPVVNIFANDNGGPITVNSGQEVELSWDSSNATSCFASMAWGGSKALDGEQTVGPLSTANTPYRYKITCQGLGGTTSDTVRVDVANPPPQPSGTIRVVSNRNTSWTITGPSGPLSGNGTEATYENQKAGPNWTIAPASLPCCGKPDVLPPSGVGGEVRQLEAGGTITYTLDYDDVGDGGLSVSISANPTTVQSGGTTEITFQSQNATSCRSEGNGWQNRSRLTGGPHNLTSKQLTANPSVFTLVCENDFGEASDTVSVTVTGTGPTGNYSCQNNACVSNPNGSFASYASCAAACGSTGNAPTLRVQPEYRTVIVGGSAHYSAKYDPDGPAGGQAEQDVSISSNWGVQPSSRAIYTGSGSGIASFRGLQPGLATVAAQYAGLVAEATLEVTPSTEPDLAVTLTPNPDNGNAPLSTTLTANVSGTETGTINYTFWWNCSYTGTNMAVAMAQCGTPTASGNTSGQKFDGVASEAQNAPTTYQTTGTKTAKVIVERGNAAPKTASAALVVRTGPPNPPDGTHAECFNNSCVQVEGDGPDRCTVNADCGGGGGEFRSQCVGLTCVNVSGSGPSTCATDFTCTGVTPSHLECQNNACVIVGGPGTNTCDTVGSSCTIEPPGPPGGETECTFTATPTLIAKGGFSKLQWSCGSGIAACTVTDESTGAFVASGGPVNQEPGVSVSPLKTTDYRITCDSGLFTETVTVRVLSITEVPPR